MSFTRQATDRVVLIRLGSLLLLLILLNSAVGLGAIRYTKQAALQDLATLEQIEAAQALAEAALVHFKVQVQEWKNILLRGDEADDLAKYRAAFEREISVVAQKLEALAADAAAAGLVNLGIEQAIETHQALQVEYETALADFVAREGTDPRRTDAEVCGIDRELTQMIDKIRSSAADQAATLRSEITQAATERYDTIFYYSAIAALIIAALVVVILLTALSSLSKR